jgi:glycosyltransferase involved in cell wall biosynthesis
MKLLFVTRYVDHVLVFFLRDLSTQLELHVVYDFENGWNEDLAKLGVATTRLAPKSRFDRGYRRRLERLHRDEGYDLVQCFHGNAELANLVQWNPAGAPLIGYRGRIGHLKLRESPAAYWSVRNPRLAAVVANSSAVKAYLNDFRWMQPRNVRVIPTGVNLDWIRECRAERHGLRERLGLPADALVVATMGSLRAVKNFGLTVTAARELAPHRVHFVHLGDDLGWARRVRDLPTMHFLPFERNPFPDIAEADVFVTTSDREAFSRASLEAMACGRPVVGPRAGGSLDLIEDGVNGAFFTPGDAADLAAKLLGYARDRPRAAAHGTTALASVEASFSTQRMAEAYLQLYADVLGAARKERSNGA